MSEAICLLSGGDEAGVQRYFAKWNDAKCVHGLTMRRNCNQCRCITAKKYPDSPQCRKVVEDGICIEDARP